MNNMRLILFGWVIFLFIKSVFCFVEPNPCANENQIPEYFLTAPCHRSTLKTLIELNANSLERCKQIAAKRRGMAINFSRSSGKKKSKIKTCIILSCPERENSTSLVFDSKYDYYSIYAYPIPPSNSSCVEEVGTYVVNFMKFNYTSAKDICREYGGDLADIGSERKTNGISQLIKWTLSKSEGPFLAYIGMDDIEREGSFIRSNDRSLTCTSYRAWAPGQPKNKYSDDDCCAIDGDQMWHVVNCKRELPFICEIFPWGEYDLYDIAQPLFCEALENDYY